MRKIYYISCDLSTAGLRFVFYRWMHPSLPVAMAQQGRLSCRRREIFWKKAQEQGSILTAMHHRSKDFSQKSRQ